MFQRQGSGLRDQARNNRRRRVFLERLEDRCVLAPLPFGALPDDTGEYMLGDVLVSVVLMESDNTLSPFDTSSENWTTELISEVKGRIEAGLNWWVESLDLLPDVRDGLLSYTIDWTYADTPVHTGYEPISRPSTDFSLWVQDFLATAGFTQGSDFLSNIRAFNNAQRIAHQKHWAFTLFVVNNAAELAGGGDGKFAPGGFDRSFAYAGGNTFVMPGDRPPEIVAHETGHMFWALDEYNRTTGSYNLHRGYYNTQNSNANPDPNFQPQISIMGAGASVSAAYAGHTSSTPSLEMIGWKDSDGDGIFDVLDVPFTLGGTGKYDSSGGSFRFVGTSGVRTLENKNPSGLQNDITINLIRRLEYKIDNGDWATAATYEAYNVDIDASFAVPPTAATVTLRTIDTRTGVMSNELVFSLSGPGQTSPGSGGGGLVGSDGDGDGEFGSGDDGLGGFVVGLVDGQGNPTNLRQVMAPDDFPEGTGMNNAMPGVLLSAFGGEVSSAMVRVQTSTSAPAAGRVFSVDSALAGGYIDRWSSARKLRVEFTPDVTSVSIRAVGVTKGSVARMEAYNFQDQLLERVTSRVLAKNATQTLSITRPAADIAYVIIKGHANTEVVLDDLEWGAVSSTASDALGGWSLPGLPPGSYRVAVSPKPFYNPLNPASGWQEITVDADGVRGVNFLMEYIANPWHNDDNAYDVNDDTFVAAGDALIVINWLNADTSPDGKLPDERGEGDFFIDVSNDGYCTAADVLLVINELNRLSNPPSGEGGSGGSGGGGGFTGGGGSGGSGEAEGEDLPLLGLAGTELARSYYASSPLHAASVPGVDPTSGGCTCGQCEAIEELAHLQAGGDSAGSLEPLTLSLTADDADDQETLARSRRRLSDVHLDESLLDEIAGDLP